MTDAPAIQDHYPDDFSHCYGCGKLNTSGHRIKTRFDGDETVTRFQPAPHHTAVPGFVYGGLVASLVDCHAMATASGHAIRQSGRDVGEVPSPRYVTAQLNVSFQRPTPLGSELEVRARVREATARKTIVDVTVSVEGTVTARGEVVAVPMPESMVRR